MAKYILNYLFRKDRPESPFKKLNSYILSEEDRCLVFWSHYHNSIVIRSTYDFASEEFLYHLRKATARFVIIMSRLKQSYPDNSEKYGSRIMEAQHIFSVITKMHHGRSS